MDLSFFPDKSFLQCEK